jgi:hypothetical protein
MLKKQPSWAERVPTSDETLVLETAYATFSENSVWPTFAHLEAQVFNRSNGLELTDLLTGMPLGLLWPDPAVGNNFPDGQAVAVTPYGLTFVSAAEADVALFFEVFRWALAARLAFTPPVDGSGEQLVPLSDLIGVLRAERRLVDADRVRHVLQMVQSGGEPFAPTFRGSSANTDEGAISIPREVRDYRGVQTAEEYFERRRPRPQRRTQYSASALLSDPGLGVLEVTSPPEGPANPLGDAAPTTTTDETRDRATDAPIFPGDVDLEELQSPPRLRNPASLTLRSRALGDLAAEIDELGFEPLVAGIADLVDEETTRLPIAIAITGKWGAGKSSMMRQLADRLKPPEKHGWRRWFGARPWRPYGRRWEVVEFDAWKHEHGERLWAGLTKAIYEAALDARNPFARAWFRTRLEWARQGGGVWLVKLIAPFVPFALALVWVFFVASNAGEKHAAGALGILALLGAVVAAARGMTGLGAVVADPFKRAIDLYTFRARFEEQLGFTSEAAADVEALTKRVTDDGAKALAVFIDDLDRCSPAHIIEVVEAVNQIFNASKRNQTLFVLGMDLDVVVASVRAAYAETIAKLPKERQEDFGREYLRKVAQLFVTVPEPDELALSQLLHSLTDGDPTAEQVAPSEEQIDAAQAQIRREAPTTAADVSAVGSLLFTEDMSKTAEAAVVEAQRRERSQRFGSNAADVAAAEQDLLPLLTRNPRALKQFDTSFRLQLHVANDSPGCELDFSYEELLALGKWVVLRLRWPDLASAAGTDPTLLRRLEMIIDGRSPTSIDDQDWLSDKELCRLLEGIAGDEPISSLPLSSFLRVV